MAEATATTVWRALRHARIDPHDVTCWNAFPFHPQDPSRGPASNRAPTRGEIRAGARWLTWLVALQAPRAIVAVGRRAEVALADAGFEGVAVRHPGRGGVGAFRSGLARVVAGGAVPSTG